MSELIRFEELRKRVADELRLDITTLTIRENHSVLLTGRNGAGKTSLLKIIAGLSAPDNCRVTFDGLTSPWASARRRFREHVIYLHQHPYLFDRSVAANVEYGLKRRRVPRHEIQEQVAEALAWAGLEHLADRNARLLSGGERQQVALIRARVLKPRLLLLDEPTANLDTEARERTYFLILRLGSEGISVIVSSHEAQMATQLGECHLQLRDGALHVIENGKDRSSDAA